MDDSLNSHLNLRLLIIGSDPLARAGLAALLNTQAGCQVVGQFSSDEADWPEIIAIYQPEVLLYDLGWHAEPEIDRLAELLDLGLPLLGLLPDEMAAGAAWAAGLHSLLPRQASLDRLAAALAAAAQGLIVLDPEFAPLLAARSPLDAPRTVEALTPRELEVLQLLAEGLPNKAIARRLEISEHTVKFHVNAIMGKLGAQSRTEAVVRATQFGLILL